MAIKEKIISRPICTTVDKVFVVFVTDDGVEFSTRRDAEKYEHYKAIPRKLLELDAFSDPDDYTNMVYLRDTEELDIYAHFNHVKVSAEFLEGVKDQLPGWVICQLTYSDSYDSRLRVYDVPGFVADLENMAKMVKETII